MRITVRRAIFPAALALGIGWSCLCLAGVLPFHRWPVSFSFVGIGCAATLLPLAFPVLFPGGEASKRRPGLESKERAFGWLTAALAAGWMGSILICLLFPGVAG